MLGNDWRGARLLIHRPVLRCSERMQPAFISPLPFQHFQHCENHRRLDENSHVFAPELEYCSHCFGNYLPGTHFVEQTFTESVFLDAFRSRIQAPSSSGPCFPLQSSFLIIACSGSFCLGLYSHIPVLLELFFWLLFLLL